MLKYLPDVPCITIQYKKQGGNMNKKIKDIARLSLVAAMYIVLTVINPLSFGAIQFRISEILMFLIFFRKDYSISLIVGCFISNLFLKYWHGSLN